MTDDTRNMILAIGLSIAILVGWQYFVAKPQVDRQKQTTQQQTSQQAAPPAPAATAAVPAPAATPAAPGAAPSQPAAQATPRVAIQTKSLKGSVALLGGRIDDLSLLGYHLTVDKTSANIGLLAPSGTAHPLYAEFGWVGASGTVAKLPDGNTLWTQDGNGPLTETSPLVLTWDNGEGLVFRRTISVDDKYMFSVADAVENRGGAPVTMFNYGLVSRHGTPKTDGYYILHEGLIGVVGEAGLQELKYSDIADKGPKSWKMTGGWLGITDKYWAAALIPNQKTALQARFSSAMVGQLRTFQTDYLSDAIVVPPAGRAEATAHLFAGAKEVQTIDAYEKKLGIHRFELMIDWGWFYFITKPLFYAIDYIYKLVGNFGISILLVTVLIKLIFFPLANKSYASMAKMKAVQPQLVALRDRYKDDKMKQQQAMMELYKKEQINPLAGCWPVAVQIPVFFALYKVLFVTIEMRHAPFYGWIRDLSAPDPTTVFNLFGLIPWQPPEMLMLGIWPLIMGVTMFVQMKMNPSPPDAAQKMIFDWMPVIFTFMLASFPAGLVIYWTWNNFLSILQQYLIMRKHGVKVELWDNIKSLWSKQASGK